jgi:hypothetical protein
MADIGSGGQAVAAEPGCLDICVFDTHLDRRRSEPQLLL